MVTFPVTFGDTNPKTTPISTFCVAFHIFVESKRREFKSGVSVDRSKSQPMDNKLSLKGAVERLIPETSNLVCMLIIARRSLRTTKCLWKGLVTVTWPL